MENQSGSFTYSSPGGDVSAAEKRKKLLVALVVVVVIGIVLFGFSSLSKRKSGPSKVPTAEQTRAFTSIASFASKSEVAVGESFTITMTMSTRDNAATGIQLELHYDPSVISVTEITPGNFLESPVEYAKKIDTKTGDITYAIGSFKEKKGTGIIAKIEARARKKTGKLSEVLTVKPTSIVTELNNKTSVLKDAKGAYLVIK